ncbi:MAG: hypothetical protein ABI693_19385 [Bryobacteraceae bacterium]
MPETQPLLSDELMKQVEETARAQNRKPSDLLEEAVKAYLVEQSWQALVGRAGKRNRVLGITEEDVPRLIAKNRAEKLGP